MEHEGRERDDNYKADGYQRIGKRQRQTRQNEQPEHSTQTVCAQAADDIGIKHGRQKQVAQLARTVPVVFMTYDILEDQGEDIRALPLEERRARLEVRVRLKPGSTTL